MSYINPLQFIQLESSFAFVGLGLVGSLLAAYLTGRVVYDLYFNPLSQFPGPKVLAVSDLPYLVWWLRGLNPHYTRRLHEKYGDIVRTSRHGLSFRSPQAWRDIYGHRVQGKKTLMKDPKFYGTPRSGKDHLLNASDEDHSRQRRLLTHAFSEKALRDQEPLIGLYVDLLITKLYEQISGPSTGKVDMVKWYNFTAFDIIGDLVFGEPFNCLENNQYHSWVSQIFQGVKAMTFLAAANHYPWISYLIFKLIIPQQLMQKHNDNFALAAAKVNRRLARGTERADFMSHILRHNDSEKGMTKSEIEANASLLMIGGSETISTFLSGCTYHFLKNRHVYDKLAEEIRTTFRTEADMTFLSTQKLPYLEAVITETLRIYPPVAVGLSRAVTEDGAMICGYFIPEGNTVSVNQWAAYRSDANFVEPDSFLPERWFPNPDPKFARDNRSVLQPFSLGPRNCIGRSLAYAEMRLILCRVLWNFDFQLCDESNNWKDQKVYSVWEKGPLMVNLVPLREGR